MITIEQVARAVAKDTFSTIGVAVGMGGSCLADLGLFHRLESIVLSPSMCGPVGAMFASIVVEVDVAMYHDGLHVRYGYRCTLCDGSINGKNVSHVVRIEE